MNEQNNLDSKFDSTDIENNKNMAGFAYFIFFLPLLAAPDSEFAKFHANQSLLLFIVSIGGSFILSVIPIISWLLLPIFSLFILVLWIMGLVNAFGGKAKELPLIGQFKIIQ